MNKGQLIEKVSHECAISKKAAEAVIDCTVENIIKAVTKGDDVRLMGFGSFKNVKRKAKTARNPKTGEAVEVPAKFAPKFQAAKDFKDRVGAKKAK